jgi:hypothetical protein
MSALTAPAAATADRTLSVRPFDGFGSFAILVRAPDPSPGLGRMLLMPRMVGRIKRTPIPATALGPLTRGQRKMFVDTLAAYEKAVSDDD